MDKKTIIPEEILQLIIARETGNSDRADLDVLEAWLKDNKHLHAEVDQYCRILHQSKLLAFSGKTEEAWNIITGRIEKKRRARKYPLILLKIAAVLVPLIIVSVWYYFADNFSGSYSIEQPGEAIASVRQSRATLLLSSGETVDLDGTGTGKELNLDGTVIHHDDKDRIRYAETKDITMHSLYVPRGSEFQLVLADGTRVYLNSGTRLDYPTGFGPESRTVTLDGEAFFDVVSDASRPFIVRTPGMDITVTGTLFNIMSYEGEPAEATLVEGTVSVVAGEYPSIVLSPGQQARIETTSKKPEIRQVNVNDYTSWTRGVFTFRDMQLKDLALRLERWYDVKISFTDPAVADMRFTGAIEKDKPLENLLALVEKSAGIDFTEKEGQIILKRK